MWSEALELYILRAMHDSHYPIAALQTSIEHGDLPMGAFTWPIYPSDITVSSLHLLLEYPRVSRAY